jgi:hypothetical protein
MNKNFEMKKNNAASVLTDEILDIFNKLDKAMALSQNVTADYFREFDPGDKEDNLAIRFEFKKVGLYAEMLEDYLFEAKKATLELVARSQNNIQELDE